MKAEQADVVVVDLGNSSITIEEAEAANIPAPVHGMTSRISDALFVNTLAYRKR